MDVIVPTLLFLVLLAGLGASVANYGGMTIPEALDWCKTHHDYTCSDIAFNQLYDDWSDIKYANRTITYQDVQKVLGYGDQLYQGALSYTDAFVEYFLGAYDTNWVADVSSRTIKVYDADTNDLVGSMEIYCGVNGSYDSNVPPTPVKDGGAVCFRYVTSSGTRYSTYLRYASGSTGEASRTILGYNNDYFSFRLADEWANNVAFIPATSDGTFYLKGVYNGNTYTNDYPLVTGIEGRDDLDTTVPYIGTAETDDGSVGIRPDGSIVMPDGSVVYPSSSTGLYPDGVTNVRLDDDYWTRLAELLAKDATGTPATSADSTVTNLNLEGIRSILASIKQSIDSLGNTIKGALTDFFTFPFDKFNVTTRDWFDKVLDYFKRFLRGFGVNV